MPRLVALISATCSIAIAFASAEAATKKVKVPDQYEGSWTITAVTRDGPCPASTSYQVQIKGGDASIPGEEVNIDGGVSSNGGVTATIMKGEN